MEFYGIPNLGIDHKHDAYRYEYRFTLSYCIRNSLIDLPNKEIFCPKAMFCIRYPLLIPIWLVWLI